MIAHRNGQFGWIVFLVLAGIVFAFWAIFLGGFIAQAGHEGAVNSGATGMERMLLENLNFFIFIGFLLSIFAVVYFGGGR